MAAYILLALGVVALAQGASVDVKKPGKVAEMWIQDIEHGISSFHANPQDYDVYRNVMDFGCVGDGVADDTACINTAISSGGRCGDNCGSSTIVPGLIYFPTGTYLISTPIIMYYYSQLVGNALDRPTIVAAPNFGGIAMLDADPYKAGGAQWYTNQNNFFRQVRNLVLDMTRTPYNAGTAGIHWQVAQATSLVNLHFLMSQQAGTGHQGVWMENGSGGFMSDLTFTGGKYGMWIGNQQFLSSRITFDGCDTALFIHWNWQWTFKDVTIRNCRIGVDMSNAGGNVESGVGSVLLLDSTIQDTQIGVLIDTTPMPHEGDTSATLCLDNVQMTNVGNGVQDVESGAAVVAGGTHVVASWVRGSVYNDESGNAAYQQDYLAAPAKSASLLAGGKFFSKARPQYEGTAVDGFASVKAGGAVGDGNTDDSDAIQNVINQNVNGKIVYFPAGTYILGKTVHVPPGTRMIGEAWSILMAGGNSFQDEANPVPMIEVGTPGQVGSVEITDFMFATKGAQPGAILVQWNLKQSAQGNAAMWDSHFRVGGTLGSNLQVAQCPKGQGAVPQCFGAHTLLHLTASSSAYLENVWAWTADHDLDNNEAQGQISLYTGRGVIIDSAEGPVWLYGTQSEHNVMYQYQLNNAHNIFMTMIQSETPYWQPAPVAPQPWTPNAAFTDPTYSHCAADDPACALSYSIIALQSSNVYIYGAGMYNFFHNYDQTCLNTENCQDSMVNMEGNTQFYFYNANTKAAVNMVVQAHTQVLALSADNTNSFCQTIGAFLAHADGKA